MTVHKGYGRFRLCIEQDIFDQLDSIEGVLATKLDLVSVRTGIEVLLNGEKRGESMIQVDWRSGLVLSVSNTFYEFELGLIIGVKDKYGSAIKFYTHLNSAQMNLDHEISILIIEPVFGGSTAAGVLLNLTKNLS